MKHEAFRALLSPDFDMVIAQISRPTYRYRTCAFSRSTVGQSTARIVNRNTIQSQNARFLKENLCKITPKRALDISRPWDVPNFEWQKENWRQRPFQLFALLEFTTGGDSEQVNNVLFHSLNARQKLIS
ncbi:hypothetical protein M514_04263, partial [Trichuris suis]